MIIALPRYPQTVTIAVLAMTILTGSFTGCDDHREPAQKNGKAVSNDGHEHKTVTADPNPDSLMAVILDRQSAVYTHPDDTQLVIPLIHVAFDTVSGCFNTVGKGVSNPAMPASAQVAARKTAASHDGRRWALLLKSWFIGNRLPLSTGFHGKIMYSKVLLEKTEGDTLYQLVQTPIGSIVVQ